MAHRHLHLFSTSLVTLVLFSALVGCTEEAAESRFTYSQNAGVSVVTEPAKLTDLVETLTSVGTARALQSVNVFSDTSGRVTAVNINADQYVDTGDLLLQLDDRDERLAVKLANVKLADAKRLADRYTTVNARDANIPESQLDDARAAVDGARIALEQAEVALDRRRITAPFAGRVGLTEIDVGDRIDTNTLITTIDDRAVLLVNFSVPEVYVERVSRGTGVEVRLWDAADKAVSGEIIAVDSRIDVNSRSFIARAAIDNSADRFRPGMAFEISLAASRGAFMSVPDIAVQWGADGAYVWVAQEGVAARREVTLVKRMAGAILVDGDLVEDDQVVMEGIQSVRAGVTLKVLTPSELDAGIKAKAPTETDEFGNG
ncbi:efflux RND transporter periplasmic adaptor subunit [Luminiphilus sp.]|nr:efflux RND transporter periplasmic adaptor subunit [Luminiphilus sp.]MDC1160876.1 efflux RND transporter periplasmic adaptor subunit [Luminiphilus sp.]